MERQMGAQRAQTVRYLISLLLYGTNGVAARFLHLESMQVVLLRTFFGWLVLTLAFLTRYRAEKKPELRDALFVLLSGVCMAADWLLLFEAYARIGVGLGMVLNYCGPVLVMLASAIFFHEKMGMCSWCALAVSFSGAVLISCEAAGTVDATGLLCAAASAVCYAAIMLTNRQAAEVSGLTRVVLQMTGTLGTVVVYALIRGGLLFRVPAGNWGAALWLGVCSTGLGSYLYFSSIPRLPVREVSVLGYVEPLSALLFSAVLLGERLRPAQMLGAGLILGGTLGMELLREKP